MDWLQFWSNVIGALAWPVAAVILGLLFRRQITALLDKVRHAKGAGFEVEFGTEVKKVAEEAQNLRPQAGVLKEEEAEYYAGPRWLRSNSVERPTAIIINAWSDVEKALLDLARGAQVSVVTDYAPGVQDWMDAISKARLLPVSVMRVIGNLNRLRNKVAHSLEWEPDTDDAVLFALTADRMVKAIQDSTKQHTRQAVTTSE